MDCEQRHLGCIAIQTGKRIHNQVSCFLITLITKFVCQSHVSWDQIYHANFRRLVYVDAVLIFSMIEIAA